MTDDEDLPQPGDGQETAADDAGGGEGPTGGPGNVSVDEPTAAALSEEDDLGLRDDSDSSDSDDDDSSDSGEGDDDDDSDSGSDSSDSDDGDGGSSGDPGDDDALTGP